MKWTGDPRLPWLAMARALILAASIAVPVRAAAVAEEAGDKMPVYMGIVQDGAGQAIVKSVFSDTRSRASFAPRQGFSIEPRGGNCNYRVADDVSLPAEYTASPVYDSAKIPMASLPEYFSNLTGAELIRKGYAETDEDALPYVNCIRQVWNSIIESQ